MQHKKHPGDWVLEAFSRGGVDLDELKRLQPSEFEIVLEHPESILPAEVNRLLITCSKLSGHPDFGLQMVTLVDRSMLGTFAYLLENAGTVDEFCCIAARYYPVFYRGATIEYHKDDKYLRLRFCVEDSGGVCPRHDNEWTMGFFSDFLEKKLGSEYTLIEVSFNSAKPNKLKRQKAAFGKNLHFDRPVTELVYPASIADKTLNFADPSLLRVLRQHAEVLLAQVIEQSSFSDSVKLLINDGLDKRDVKSEDIADKLALSLSAMKRKLAAENTNFRRLKLEVISELAQELLLHSDSSIGDIAARLGYSDQSAFCRVFRKENNVSPMKFRKNNI